MGCLEGGVGGGMSGVALSREGIYCWRGRESGWWSVNGGAGPSEDASLIAFVFRQAGTKRASHLNSELDTVGFVDGSSIWWGLLSGRRECMVKGKIH